VRGRYPNVEHVGFVPDSIAFLQCARVVAIPTLSGGGIQIKTLDAIASGSRIVATECAVRGLANLPGTVKVATDPQSFAGELVRAVRTEKSPAGSREAIAWCSERERRFREQIRLACGSLSLTPIGPDTIAQGATACVASQLATSLNDAK
jgi:polysaccharide biosynthesis protein PslH